MAIKQCTYCGENKTTAHFISTNSPFFNGTLPICRDCIAEMIAKNDGNWNFVDKLCQWTNIPFVPEEWEKIYEGNRKGAFGQYCQIFRNEPYNSLDWQQYNEVYLQLEEEDRIEDAIPKIKAHNHRALVMKWGQNYDDEELEYLENLHSGIMHSQNVVGALNADQVLKLCKLSLNIEQKIRAGSDFTKELKAYDDLTKIAGLSSVDVKDGNEFNSIGEIMAYLEKLGFKPSYYDGVIRDEADFALKDIKYWLQYLYTNETGLSDEIEQRIQNLKIAAELNGNDFNEKEFRQYIDEQSTNPSIPLDDDFVPTLS